MPRQLVTIGDLHSPTPLRRQRQRRERMQGYLGMIGSADASTGGAALQDASLALLNHFDTLGVPLESTQDALVGAFQLAWNQDPLNASDQLVPDSKYGPLTRGALDAMVGGIAPAVNFGGNPPSPPKPSPAPAPAPATPTVAGGGDESLMIWLLIGAALVGGYFLLRKKKGRSGGSHRRSSPLVEVRSNPRRRRNAALIP